MKLIFYRYKLIKWMFYYYAFVDNCLSSKLEMKIKLVDYEWENMHLVQQFFTEVFPIPYEFHNFIEMFNGDLVKLAFHDDELVGFLYSHTDASNPNVFMIGSIGCLPKYRHQGIGSYLLEYALNYAVSDGGYKYVHLYLQTCNTIALKFYKKYGFKIIKEERNYYFKTTNADAYKMEKVIHSVISVEKLNSTIMNQAVEDRPILRNRNRSKKKTRPKMETLEGNIRSLIASKLKDIFRRKSNTVIE